MNATMDRLSRLRRQRRISTLSTFALVLLGPMLALATFLVLGPLNTGSNSGWVRTILLTDMIYVLVVAALIAQRIARMISARRAKSAGSRLHMRLTGVFTLVALVPTILVAVFSAITLNFGLEGWFSDRVRQVVDASQSAAATYEAEHRADLIADSEALANFISDVRQRQAILPDGDLRQVLTQGQGLVQRGLREAFVINADGQIKARGERSYLFDFEQPSPQQIERARNGETVLIEDWDNDEFRALVNLRGFRDRLLYVSREVDGDILNLLDDTQETATLYQEHESERGRLLFEFGLLYLGFALILILAAIWLGLWFAERLSRPVGRLAGAAQRVGAGDLDVQVIEDNGDDEIAMLGRLFNQMTRQLKGQRETLLDNTSHIERRRRLFDSVLSSVTAGVVGVDGEGQIAFINRAAERLLAVDEKVIGAPIDKIVPEFAAIFTKLKASASGSADEEIKLVRHGKQESFHVRMSTRESEDQEPEGYVIAFDDVTDLVSAQRMAAWGDVARRIAHEIKNPLTPIQLSAERLKRKFMPKAGDEAPALEQYTDVIIRQTGDLRRIVDEFSRFARMPTPERRSDDLRKLLSDIVALQDAGQSGVRITADIPDQPMQARIDATLLGQALTNLIKNAGEATETYKEKHPDIKDYQPEVRVSVNTTGLNVEITVSDNGIGLPEDRAKLFEPYVTHRENGTGLGLPIVKKIIEEHGGTLRLVDAEEFETSQHRGAMAVVTLPNVLIEQETPNLLQQVEG